MSYYDNQQWAPSNTPGWEQQTPPVRSGTSSAVPRDDSSAFATQLEEVDRAYDNLVKSGKIFNLSSRRESMSVVGGPARAYSEHSFDPRLGGGPSRHHSVSEFGDARSFSGSALQSFYASQRHQPSRATNEAEQMMQAKRRMAAQRERELRNYHQEQQFNRSVTAEITTFGGKSDTTLSPNNGIKGEERRELIARQRNALYSEGSSYSGDAVFDENGNRVLTPGLQPGTSLLSHGSNAFEQFNASNAAENNQNHGESQAASSQTTGQPRSRANSLSSPASNPANSFSLYESTTQQASRTSTSSPGESPSQGGKTVASSGVAPIGTRPSGQVPSSVLTKRSTTPLPSPLSFGFVANEGNSGEKEAHNTCTQSQNGQAQQDNGLGWVKSSVWGNKSSLSVQAPVWG